MESQTASPSAATRKPRRFYPLAVWLACRNDFVTGQGTLTDLASKHAINPVAAITKAKLEKWGHKRELYMARQAAKLEASLETPPAQSGAGFGLLERVRVIETRIGEAELALAQAENGKEMQAIATALNHLYNIWSLLTGHEKPGIRKPAQPKRGPGYITGSVPE